MAQVVDPVWHKKQVTEYSQKEKPAYDDYARFLKEVLEVVCRRYAPLAIVQARSKAVASFAEKAARKYTKYKDPLVRMTDLCGARAITHTREEVEMLSQFIERNFIIDIANSENKRTLLRNNEFGYLSNHLVVQVPEGASEILGVKVPPSIGRRKAEIQLRTLAEHVWADILHDRMYKTPIKPPDRLHREGNRLAALLEKADEAFSGVADEVDYFVANYAAQFDGERLAAEHSMLNLVLENDPDQRSRAVTALRVAGLYAIEADWLAVVQTLRPFRDAGYAVSSDIKLRLGTAQARLGDEANLAEGRTLLESIASAPPDPAAPCSRKDRTRRAAAKAELARSYRQDLNRSFDARKLLREAVELDPQNPYLLCALLEYEIYCTRDRELASSLLAVLQNAIQECRRHIEAGMDLMLAYMTIGRLEMLRSDAMKAYRAYARAICAARYRPAPVALDMLRSEEQYYLLINQGRQPSEDDRRAMQLLLLGQHLIARQANDEACCAALQKRLGGQQRKWEMPLTIVAGSGRFATPEEKQRSVAILRDAGSHLCGTVISGGTQSGVSEIVGEWAATGAVFAVGYLPSQLPAGEKEDGRYQQFVRSGGREFSVSDVLNYWSDIVISGISPATVQMLGVGGGEIAAFEYCLAAAMGARVALIDGTGRSAVSIPQDPDWRDVPNLFAMPCDPATVQAFCATASSWLRPDELDAAAQKVHEAYIDHNAARDKQWDKCELKESNRHQVIFARTLFAGIGYEVRKAAGKIELPDLSAYLEKLAQCEHGRWNTERLSAGWRFGKAKDTARKISPYLVPWLDLPQEIREDDIEAVKMLPRVLAAAGYEIVRPQPGDSRGSAVCTVNESGHS